MNADTHARKRLACLWKRAVLLLLLLGSACAAPAGQPPDPNSLVIAVPRGKISATLEATIAAYAKDGGEPVRVTALTNQEYGAQVNAALLAGLNSYDLVYLPAEDLARWAGYSAIQPLTGSFGDPSLDPWRSDVTVAGRLYGLPTQPDPSVLWYRADLLQSAGVTFPTTWDALLQSARLLETPEHYGIVTARVDFEAGIDFAAVLAGSGGEMVSDHYLVGVNDAPAIRALETYAALTAPGAENFTRADVLSALRSGRAVFGIAPLSAAAILRDCKASPKVCPESGPLLTWAQLPGLPAKEAIGDLGAWAIPIHAAHSAQAQRLLEWLGGEAGASAWLHAGGTPAHRQVLATDVAWKPLGQMTRYRQAFPPVINGDALWKAISTAISAVQTGQQPPEKALQAAAVQMRQALRQAGYSSEE